MRLQALVNFFNVNVNVLGVLGASDRRKNETYPAVTTSSTMQDGWGAMGMWAQPYPATSADDGRRHLPGPGVQVQWVQRASGEKQDRLPGDEFEPRATIMSLTRP